MSAIQGNRNEKKEAQRIKKRCSDKKAGEVRQKRRITPENARRRTKQNKGKKGIKKKGPFLRSLIGERAGASHVEKNEKGKFWGENIGRKAS